MPTTIKVMSWNIESLGAGKAALGSVPPQQSEAISFIATTIREAGADLVGIMEVKSGYGARIKEWLIALLNNARPAGVGYEWKGNVSSRQDGGTKEEYIILWKDQQAFLELDAGGVPGPTSLIGVVDANALAPLFASKQWNAAQQDQFFQALSDSGYVMKGQYQNGRRKPKTNTWRVTPGIWPNLAAAPVRFANPPATQPPGALGAGELASLAAQLRNIDILRFLSYGDRSPFMANFLVGAPNPTRLMLTLLHAPGPQDPDRLAAINVMGLSLPMAAQVAQGDSLLLMGDFNVDDARLASLNARTYTRGVNTQGQFGFMQITPVDLHQVFAPISGAPPNNGVPFDAPDLLPGSLTTLVNTYLPDLTPPADVLGNTYDKFFFHGSTTPGKVMTQANPFVIPMVAVTATNQHGYNHALASQALTFFRAFRGSAFLVKKDRSLAFAQATANKRLTSAANRVASAQTAIAQAKGDPQILQRRLADANSDMVEAVDQTNALNAQRSALAGLLDIVRNAAVQAPLGIGSALIVYRFAVSDHLPITVQLTAA